MENGQNSLNRAEVLFALIQVWLFALRLLGVNIPWVVVLLPLLLVCGAMVLAVIMLCVAMAHDTDGEKKGKKEDSSHEHTA